MGGRLEREMRPEIYRCTPITSAGSLCDSYCRARYAIVVTLEAIFMDYAQRVCCTVGGFLGAGNFYRRSLPFENTVVGRIKRDRPRLT